MRSRLGKLVSALFVAALLVPAMGWACTAALLTDGSQRRVVKSFDWHDGSGYLLQNAAGRQKTALMLRPGASPLKWTARYASLTINQHGPEMPLSGMNERGLVVETLWLRQTRWPRPDRRPVVNELQLVQWLLDTAADTKTAVKSLRKVRISAVSAKVHWLVCDRSGDCATVEYLDGKLVTHHAAGLSAPALTNHPYGTRAGKSASRALRGSVRRFDVAKRAAVKRGGRSLAERSEAMLTAVAAGSYTKWQLRWDPVGMTLRFRVPGASGRRVSRSVSFRKPVRCAPTTGLSLQSRVAGDVTERLSALDEVAVTRQVSRSIARLGLPNPGRIAAKVVQSAKQHRCVPTAGRR